jgi:hypothetical protein
MDANKNGTSKSVNTTQKTYIAKITNPFIGMTSKNPHNSTGVRISALDAIKKPTSSITNAKHYKAAFSPINSSRTSAKI